MIFNNNKKYARKTAEDTKVAVKVTEPLKVSQLEVIKEQTEAINLSLANKGLDIQLAKEIQNLTTILTNIQALKRLEMYIKKRLRILEKCTESLNLERDEIETVATIQSIDTSVVDTDNQISRLADDFAL